jgi:hypothetical protein
VEAGGRDDGVEKRVREMRDAEAASLREQEERHRELSQARERLGVAFLSHLSQLTSNEVTLLKLEDAPYSLEAIIHFENKEGLWHRSIFVFGVDTYKDTDADTHITYFLTPARAHDLPTPPGAKPLEQLLGATLGAVVERSAEVAVEVMARESYVGAKLLTDAESLAKERERAKKSERPDANKKKGNGCVIALWWFLGLMVFAAIVGSFNG